MTKKIMTQFCFELPEDFEGSFSDGLRVVADYLDMSDESANVDHPPHEITEGWNKLYTAWQGAITRGHRFFGFNAVAKTDDLGKSWVKMNQDGSLRG